MRASGILMHISSLPSKYGIGTLGQSAFEFVDFLKRSKQTYWQVLPVNPTSYGDSPYQSPSAFAGNPYFIDLDFLCHDGLLDNQEIESYNWGLKSDMVDYELLFKNRYPLLKKAFERFNPTEQYYDFEKKNSFWLDNYALFMAVKEHFNNVCWLDWDSDIRLMEIQAVNEYKSKLSNEIYFYKFLQYLFYSQWNNLKKYANEQGIRLIGDMPIYVALDSAEVWTTGKYFMLDEKNMPIEVAGVPPDAFSPTGQLWGNPIYNWDSMRNDGYSWWIKRIEHSMTLFDKIRIDHFRGFEAFYTIPYGRSDATIGQWRKGPAYELFDSVKKALGDVDIIAEDLGFLTPEVFEMLDQCGYPGMKVLQFAFDPYGDSQYLPHNYIKNCIAYTGTHDNDTSLSWFDTSDEQQKKFAMEYLYANKRIDVPDALIRSVMSSVADTVIIPIQDYLCLDSSARMNTPSKLGGNWQFRITKYQLSDDLSNSIAAVTHIYRRG